MCLISNSVIYLTKKTQKSVLRDMFDRKQCFVKFIITSWLVAGVHSIPDVNSLVVLKSGSMGHAYGPCSPPLSMLAAGPDLVYRFSDYFCEILLIPKYVFCSVFLRTDVTYTMEGNKALRVVWCTKTFVLRVV